MPQSPAKGDWGKPSTHAQAEGKGRVVLLPASAPDTIYTLVLAANLNSILSHNPDLSAGQKSTQRCPQRTSAPLPHTI
jgi:hypothetical protein